LDCPLIKFQGFSSSIVFVIFSFFLLNVVFSEGSATATTHSASAGKKEEKNIHYVKVKQSEKAKSLVINSQDERVHALSAQVNLFQGIVQQNLTEVEIKIKS
jgi:biopolymer transport protein ExbD